MVLGNFHFHFQGVLQIRIIVEQGPAVLAVGAIEGCLDSFTLDCHFSFVPPSRSAGSSVG